jgi:hypothetical protein
LALVNSPKNCISTLLILVSLSRKNLFLFAFSTTLFSGLLPALSKIFLLFLSTNINLLHAYFFFTSTTHLIAVNASLFSRAPFFFAANPLNAFFILTCLSNRLLNEPLYSLLSPNLLTYVTTYSKPFGLNLLSFFASLLIFFSFFLLALLST